MSKPRPKKKGTSRPKSQSEIVQDWMLGLPVWQYASILFSVAVAWAFSGLIALGLLRARIPSAFGFRVFSVLYFIGIAIGYTVHATFAMGHRMVEDSHTEHRASCRAQRRLIIAAAILGVGLFLLLAIVDSIWVDASILTGLSL